MTIHGFPFLTQALGGDYSHISVSAAGVPVGDKLQDVAVNAELEDVTAPLSDLTNGNTKAITIGKLTGPVTIKAADLARISPLDKIKDLRIEPATSRTTSRTATRGQSEPTPTTTTTEGQARQDEASTRCPHFGTPSVRGQGSGNLLLRDDRGGREGGNDHLRAEAAAVRE